MKRGTGAFNAESQITKWTQQADAATPTVHHFEYDSANQLLADTVKNQNTQAILKQYIYGYDKAGNRTSEQVNHAVTTASHNSVNQLTGTDGTGGGPTRFEGDLSELATVNVSTASTNVVASVDSNKVFRATLNLPVGTNTVAIVARDYSGNNNTSTNRYKVVVGSAGGPRTLTYDLNGNCVNDGAGRTFEWDAKDQLVAINQGTHRTEMEYDGMSRRVHIVEKESNVVVDEKRFVWCGMELCEERDGTGGTVTKRFFGQGVQIVGGPNAGNYFYTRDHLGSVRELVAADGVTVAARYDYDPYGRRTLVSGTDLADFGYTGFYVHKPSGLNLAPFRAYDADLGRWLSRDPIGLAGGLNPYAYARNNPINAIDPLGLDPVASEIAERFGNSAMLTYLMQGGGVGGPGANYGGGYQSTSNPTGMFQQDPTLVNAALLSRINVENTPSGSGEGFLSGLWRGVTGLFGRGKTSTPCPTAGILSRNAPFTAEELANIQRIDELSASEKLNGEGSMVDALGEAMARRGYSPEEINAFMKNTIHKGIGTTGKTK